MSFLFCLPAFAKWVSTLKEIYETPIPFQIRKSFSEVTYTHNTCSGCELRVLDGDKFFDIYPRKFLVLSLLPNSFGGIWAYIAIEGERKRTFRLWLYNLPNGEYDLRSVEELPNSMDEKFFGQLQDPAHKSYWI
jgi:hypothetical protein